MSSITRSVVQPFSTVKEDAITALLSIWLMAGLMIDGWAHTTRGGVESFFTPWHALFYSGFLATAGWMIYVVRRPRQGLITGGVPTGYRLGLSGLAVFGVGGVLDLIWHQALGVEANIDALVSPTHMILLLGTMLVVTTPIRSSWHRPTPRESPWAWVAPAVVATGLSGLLAQFFVFYGSAWQEPAFRFEWQAGQEDFLVGFSVLGLLVSTTIFMVACLLILVRWSPPFGTFAMILGTIGLGLQGVHGFESPGELVGVVAAGLLLDLMNVRLHPSPQSPVMLRTWAFVAPIVVWTVHAVYLAVMGELGWPPVLWGAIVLQGLAGLALAILVVPPPLPEASR